MMDESVRLGAPLARAEEEAITGHVGRRAEVGALVAEEKRNPGIVSDTLTMRTPAPESGPADWVGEGLLKPWSGSDGGNPVGAIVPTGFEAYARVFPTVYEVPPEPPAAPPAPLEAWQPLRWSEVAAMNGRIAHPLMEWHLISTRLRGAVGRASN
jgi:hypothetical protein